jgi:hypothetical protein
VGSGRAHETVRPLRIERAAALVHAPFTGEARFAERPCEQSAAEPAAGAATRHGESVEIQRVPVVGAPDVRVRVLQLQGRVERAVRAAHHENLAARDAGRDELRAVRARRPLADAAGAEPRGGFLEERVHGRRILGSRALDPHARMLASRRWRPISPKARCAVCACSISRA